MKDTNHCIKCNCIHKWDTFKFLNEKMGVEKGKAILCQTCYEEVVIKEKSTSILIFLSTANSVLRNRE